MAASSHITPAEPSLAVFHRTFLKELKRFGRVNEFWVINSFNMKPGILKAKIRSGYLKEELSLGLRLLKKGRLHIIPRRSKGIRRIRQLMRQDAGVIER
jgi:hypothetical protein